MASCCCLEVQSGAVGVGCRCMPSALRSVLCWVPTLLTSGVLVLPSPGVAPSASWWLVVTTNRETWRGTRWRERQILAWTNCMCGTCVEYLDNWARPVEKFACFTCFAVSHRWCKQFLISSGGPASLLARCRWTRYFENSKNGACHSELLNISQFAGPLNATLERAVNQANPVDTWEQHVECWLAHVAVIATVKFQSNFLYRLPYLPE